MPRLVVRLVFNVIVPVYPEAMLREPTTVGVSTVQFAVLVLLKRTLSMVAGTPAGLQLPPLFHLLVAAPFVQVFCTPPKVQFTLCPESIEVVLAAMTTPRLALLSWASTKVTVLVLTFFSQA